MENIDTLESLESLDDLDEINSGLLSVSFFKNKHLKFVSIGEMHHLYNINKPNVFHEWIVQDKIADATLILESTQLWRHDCCQTVLGRYFKPDNIFSTDAVRDEFIYTSSEMYVSSGFDDNIKDDESDSDDDDEAKDLLTHAYVKDFLTNSNNQPILEREYLTKYIQNHNKLHLYNKNRNRYAFQTTNNPGLAIFMDLAAKYNNIYNIFANCESSEKSNTDLNKLVNLIRQLKKYTKVTPISFIPFSQSYAYEILGVTFGNIALTKVIPPVQNMIIKYELLLYQYLTYNFIYRVCRWVMKYTDSAASAASAASAIPQPLYIKIVGYMRTSTKRRRDYNKMIDILARMLDYIAILKILDLYDAARSADEEALVWLAAGGAHNSYINRFMCLLFNLVDAFTITKTHESLNYNNRYFVRGDPTPTISSQDFRNFIDANPQFGVVNKKITASIIQVWHNRFADKSQLLEIFSNAINYLYPQVSNRNALIKLLAHPDIDLDKLQRLIPLTTANAPISINTLKIILKCTEEDLKNCKLVINSYYGFGSAIVNPILGILSNAAKPFSKTDFYQIKSYPIADILAHPDNISFKDMVAGKSILELPTQSQEDIADLHQLKQEYQRPIGTYVDIEIPIQDYDYCVEQYKQDLMTKEPLWKKTKLITNLGRRVYGNQLTEEEAEALKQEEDELFRKNQEEVAEMKRKNEAELDEREAKHREEREKWRRENENKEILDLPTIGGFEHTLLLCGLAIPINLILLAVLVMVFLYLVFNIACQEKCPPRYTVNYD